MRNRLKRIQVADSESLSELNYLWQSTILFFNKTMEAVQYFPDKVRMDLHLRIKKSSIEVCDKIAAASKSENYEVYDSNLRDAIELLHMTAAALYISYKWSYLQEGIFNQLSQDAKILVKQINELIWSARFSELT